ncbi:MAG: threonine synthase [Bacteroidetes bacterium]|nr:threonine synthase [Bacteroidota bacterium]
MIKPLKLYSTNLQAKTVSFPEALIKGIAPDKGLYMPEKLPHFTQEDIAAFSHMEYFEIAYEVIRKFLVGEMEERVLSDLVKDAYNFKVPLEQVVDNKYILRLDQGPTASFKDFAARMMARLMNYYLSRQDKNLLILTATSGDTGSAIANAYYGLDNIRVLVLFPEKEVTERQRKQMTTLGKNVQIIAIDGKFDDCQAMVKEAFADSGLDHLNLSSANSINIGRLIPQTVYYFYAFAKLRKGKDDEDVIFSIPSGNFGDMMGGVMAKEMGLPVKKFVVATNENDVFPVFMKTGHYTKIEPSRNCISSAMNVGHPSNMSRLIALYGGIMDEKGAIGKMPDMDQLRAEIYAVSINEDETRNTIKGAWDNHKVLLEPHGSVAWAGLNAYLAGHQVDEDQLCISLETAHPAKFPEEIRRILGFDPALPATLTGLEDKAESFDSLASNYADFRDYLLIKYK